MSKNPIKLNIAYLYPDILYGDCNKANVETFVKRASWRDIDVKVDEIYANSRIKASKYDFYYIGGSNSENLEYCLRYLRENAEELKIASYAQVPMLAINIGYQLFGSSIQFNNQQKLEGIDILNVNSIAGKKIRYGSVVGMCNFLRHRTIVGFENHKMATYLKDNVAPFLILSKGMGNNKNKTEGARFQNVVGSYITSPILAQNPNFCDFFIATALKIKYKCRIPLTQLCDDIEWYSHDYIKSVK